METTHDDTLFPDITAFDPEEYVNTKQVAERTLTSYSSWAKRRMSGEGPAFIKIGRTVRYRWGDVVCWLEGQLRSSTSEY